MSSLFSNASGGDKHRETQLQLQRKLQEREMLKELKRRLHQQRQENEHETKSPHRTRNESYTPGLPSPKTKFLSPSSCLRFRSSSSLENLLMPTAVSDNKSHIKDQAASVPTSGRERVLSSGSKTPAISHDTAMSAAQMKIYSTRSLFQDKSLDRQCAQSEGSETRIPSRSGTKEAGPDITDSKQSKTPELATFHSLKKPSVIPIQSWADEKNSSTQPPCSRTGPSNLSAMLSTSAQTATDSLHKPQLLTTDINQNIKLDPSLSEKAISSSNAFMLNMVLEKTSRVGTGVPLVSQTGSAKSAFVPFSQMHLQNIAETKTTQSADYLPTSSQKSTDHSSEPSILAQMLECNDNNSTLASPNSNSSSYIQVPTLKSGWESEGATSVSSTECVTQTSPSVTKRPRSRFAPIRPKAMQAKTILSLLQEQSGNTLDSTPYDRRRVATILKEKHAREQTETVNQSASSTPLPVTATAAVATSAFATATEVVTFPMNPVVSKPNELLIILGSPATGTVSAAGNVFISPSQNSSNMATLDKQQATPAGTAIFQTIPSVNSSVASQTEMVISNGGNASNVNTATAGETLAWKTIQLDTTSLPHIAIPSQQLFTSLNPQQEAGSTSSLGIAVPLSGGLVSTTDAQECTVDPSTQFMISKNIQLDGALLSAFNFNIADPLQSAQTISVSNLLPTDLATSQVTVKMETVEPDNSLLMTTSQVPKRLSEDSTSSILQHQPSTEIVNSATSIGKFVLTNFGTNVSMHNEEALLSAGSEGNSQSEIKVEKSNPPTKPASLLRPLLNSDLLPGEFTKTKILNELLSTEDSLPESSPIHEIDSLDKHKLDTIDKSNTDNHPKNEPKTQSANSDKITLPVQTPLTTMLDSISTSVVAKTEKFTKRPRTISNQGPTVSTSQLRSRTLSADATSTVVSYSNPTCANNVLQQLPLSHATVASAEQLTNFASAHQNATVSPSMSCANNLNACLLTDTVVTYSSQVVSSHVTGDLVEPSLPEDKNCEMSPPLPNSNTKDRADQLLKDLGVAPKQETGKSQPEIHPTSRKRKASEKSSSSNTKRKQQSNKAATDLIGQLDSSIATSPLVSSGQDWMTLGTTITENPEGVSSGLNTEPLQSPDISSVEKDALLDSTPQMLGLELSNAGSMHCMPTSKMSCHSQTMLSSTDNKTLPSANLSSSQQFDRHISDLLSLVQPLSNEGISAVNSPADSASLSNSQLSLQGVPYSQLSPQQVNMATELAVFKRSVTDTVAALLQPTDQKTGQTSQGVPSTATQKCQFPQEAPSLLQKHLTNMVDASLTDPHEEQRQQQQCAKSSFLCEILQSSDIISKTKDFLEEELPSDVADFITESMTSNQNESVFPNGSTGSNTSTSNLQPFPDLKLDVEDLLNQATPSSNANVAAAAAPPVNTTADLGANVFVPEDTLKHTTTSVSILGEAETSKTLNSTQNRPFRDHLENSNTFAIPDAQAVVRKGVEVKQSRFSAATSHQPQQQASSVQATSTEPTVFRMSGQAPEFVAPNVTISQRWHTLSYEKTGSHTPVSDSGYSSASPIRSTPPTVPFSFGSSAENLVSNVIGHLEHRSASCEPPNQSPLAEPVQAYTPIAALQASNVSAGPSPTSLPPSPQTFTPIHGSSLSGTTYDPPPIRPTATVANKTLSTPQLNSTSVGSSQQPSRTNKENNRELLNLLQAKSPPSYENAIRMLSQKSPRAAASGQIAQRSPGPVSSNISDAPPQSQQIATPAMKPRSKARSRSTSNTATKSRRKRSMKESGCMETKGTQMPQLVRCLSDNSALPSSSVATAMETNQPETDTKSDKDKSSAPADGPPSKTKKSVQISPAYPFSYKLSLLKDRSAVGGQVIASGDSPVVSVEHPPTASQASFLKLAKSGKVKQEEGLGSGMSAGGGTGGSGTCSNRSVTTSRSQSVPLQNVTSASTQPKHGGRQPKKSTHISDLPNVNYMGNAPNVDLSRVFWEKLLTTTKSCTQGVTVTSVSSSKGGNSDTTSTVNPVTAPSSSSTKRNLIQLLEDRTSSTEEVKEFKSNLDDLFGMHCLTAGDFQTLVSSEALNQSLLITSVQPQIVTSSVSSTQPSAVSATTTTTTTTTTTVPSSTPITNSSSSSSNSSVLEEELTAGAYQGQRSLNHPMSFSPHSMQ